MKYILFFILTAFSSAFYSQDDLDAMLDDMEEKETIYTTATFKGTRLINLHTIEAPAKNQLEFLIQHRFGAISGGAYELYGLDQSTIRLGLEYGLTNFLTIGIGRSTYEKTVDGYFNCRLLKQSKGKRVFPFSASYYSAMTVNGLKWQNPNRQNYFTSRLAYVHQLILARKFNKSISLQLSPTIVHRNLVKTIDDENTTYAIGAGGRIKLSRRMAIIAEYIYRVPPPIITDDYTDYVDSFSFGFELETGGHVFQLQFTNSLAMIEKGFILETSEKWSEIGIHFGFNISREFSLKH